MPSAWVISTMSGGCQSVMNPGWVSVCTAAGRSPSSALAEIHSSVISNRAPIFCSVSMAVTRRSWAQPATRTCPPVIRPADQVGERLEPVALQPGAGAPRSSLDALDDDAPVGLEADAGAHALEEQRQLGDLGLEGGVAEHRAALGQHGGEQHALGGADAGVGQGDLGAAQPVGAGADAVGATRRPRRPSPRARRCGSRPGAGRCGRRRPGGRTPRGCGRAAAPAAGWGCG